MASGTWTTTADEDAAILALTATTAAQTKATPETVPQFINRHIRHQVDFAVAQAKESVQVSYDKLPPTEKAKIDAILDANKQKGGKP